MPQKLIDGPHFSQRMQSAKAPRTDSSLQSAASARSAQLDADCRKLGGFAQEVIVWMVAVGLRLRISQDRLRLRPIPGVTSCPCELSERGSSSRHCSASVAAKIVSRATAEAVVSPRWRHLIPDAPPARH